MTRFEPRNRMPARIPASTTPPTCWPAGSSAASGPGRSRPGHGRQNR